MVTSVRTKAVKKQPSSSGPSSGGKTLENALLSLENACFAILDAPAPPRRDAQGLYWRQRLINIANPVSLALMESKGPRHFHYHYRHRNGDETILRPVLDNAVDTLAQVCEEALSQCRYDLAGLDDAEMESDRRQMEAALAGFLRCYKAA